MALPVVNASRYSTTLPSTGQEIEYRPYLVKEEKIMMVALESKDKKAIMRAMKDVAQACVFTDIIIDSLTSFDLEWLFLKLRTKSVGENTRVKLKCEDEGCNKSSEVNVNLDDISLSKINENKVIQLTDDIGVVMKYPQIGMLEEHDEETIQTPDGAFNMIIDCLETIYDEDNVYQVIDESRESIKGFIDNLNSLQFGMIADWLKDMPSLEKDIEWNCVACNKENTVKLRGLQSFFT